jgi:GNAT superfamily N-acetyltransferase
MCTILIMNIGILTPSDLRHIPALQPDGWQDITPAIEYYTRSSFCFPIKVVVENDVAGIGCAIIHDDVAWLGHIVVHRDHRNKGLGRLITQSLVESKEVRACETVYLIATDLGEPVYRKLGFEAEGEYLFYKEIAMPVLPRHPDISEELDQYVQQIVLLDRECSGEDRSVHLKEHLAGGYVLQRKGRIDGFYLPAFGDGLIVASTAEAGVALMKFRLSTKDSASFPIENTEASAFLEKLGYFSFRKAKRMRLGANRTWKATNLYNRVGGNIG